MVLTNYLNTVIIILGLVIGQTQAHFKDLDPSHILYQDNNIVVLNEGVFSKRTGNPIKFRQSPKWKEEDFFTQQEKYCEKDTATEQQSTSNIQALEN